MWNCTLRNQISNWSFRKSELHLKFLKSLDKKKKSVMCKGIRGKSEGSISVWRNFPIFPEFFLHSFLAKELPCWKREVSYKALFRPQGLVHHMYSVRQESWRKNNTVSYCKSQTEVVQGNLDSGTFQLLSLDDFCFHGVPYPPHKSNLKRKLEV